METSTNNKHLRKTKITSTCSNMNMVRLIHRTLMISHQDSIYLQMKRKRYIEMRYKSLQSICGSWDGSGECFGRIGMIDIVCDAYYRRATMKLMHSNGIQYNYRATFYAANENIHQHDFCYWRKNDRKWHKLSKTLRILQFLC